MADLQQSLNEGHCTILDADVGVGTLTGRADANCIPWQDTADAVLPTVMYQPIELFQDRGGVPAHWTAVFQLDAFASGNGASKKVNDLIEAALAALTHNAFKAPGIGLDVTVMRTHRQPWPPQEQKTKSSSRLVARATVTITYRVLV